MWKIRSRSAVGGKLIFSQARTFTALGDIFYTINEDLRGEFSGVLIPKKLDQANLSKRIPGYDPNIRPTEKQRSEKCWLPIDYFFFVHGAESIDFE